MQKTIVNLFSALNGNRNRERRAEAALYNANVRDEPIFVSHQALVVEHVEQLLSEGAALGVRVDALFSLA